MKATDAPGAVAVRLAPYEAEALRRLSGQDGAAAAVEFALVAFLRAGLGSSGEDVLADPVTIAMVELRERGLKHSEIAAQLNSMGMLTTRKQRWYSYSVSRRLKAYREAIANG